MAVTRALSPAQQRALVLVATFFVASAYLCATRLVNASFGHEAPARQSAADAAARLRPAAGAGAAEVRLEPADLPMSYGQYGRPGLNGMGRLVAALPADRVPSAANARRLVVGDVHGMDAALARLLDRVAFDAARDHVVAVGDLVAKGPESPAVVARLMRLHASAVRGNHEDHVLLSRAEAAAARGLRARLASPDAELHRGQAAHLAVARSLSQPQLDWLAGLPLVLDARPLPLYVHAGLVPGLTLDRQDPWAVMNMRSLVYPREELRSEEKAAGKKQDLRRHQDPPPTPSTPPDNDDDDDAIEQSPLHPDRAVAVPVEHRNSEPWADAWNRHQKRLAKPARRTVIYGHDAKRGYVEGKHTLGIDSGCAAGGALTALIIEGADNGGFKRKTMQVPCGATSGEPNG